MSARPDRRLISIAAAADYLGVSTKTLRRWIAAGRLQAFRVGPRILRVDLAELEAMARPIPTTGEL